MRAVKLLLVTAFLMAGAVSFGQTKMIAHKSHSGKASNFSIASEDNFGVVPHHNFVKPDSVQKISDEYAVEFYPWHRDTVSYHHHYHNTRISLDSLKKLYPDTKFVGFEYKDPHGNNKKVKPRGAFFYLLFSGGGPGGNSGTGLLSIILILFTALLAYVLWEINRKQLKAAK